MIEEANALTQQNMGNAHMDFVEQTRLQGLLDRACPMKGNIFLACKLPCFRNCALDAIGDKVILRLALFHGFSGLRLQDHHLPGDSRAIRPDSPILAISHSEACVPYDHRAPLVERTAHDFIEAVPGA